MKTYYLACVAAFVLTSHTTAFAVPGLKSVLQTLPGRQSLGGGTGGWYV